MRDGAIAFAEGAIDVATTRTQFLALHPTATLVTDNPPHRTYRFGPSAVLGRSFYVNAGFSGESLRVIRMTAADGPASWDEVTDATLVADKRANDQWLREAFGLGPATKFAWGTVSSAIDRRTGGALITIDFAAR